MDLSEFKPLDFSDPSVVAEILFKRVEWYCENLSEDRPGGLNCMEYHNPNAFFTFVNSFLPKEIAEKIKKAPIGNPTTFWQEVEKEYEKLWKEWWPDKVARLLGRVELEGIIEGIMNRNTPSYEVERLKAYAEVLREFADSIKHALQEQKPLSPEQLYEWYKRIHEVASPWGFDKWARIALEYELRPYEMYKEIRLPTLRLLLEYVNQTIQKIENKYLPKLEALTNKS